MTTEDLVKVNKDYFVKTSTVAFKTVIFGAFPYLNVPPLNWLIAQAIDWIMSKIADLMELGSYFIYIDYRVNAQGKDYVLAAHNADKLQTEELKKVADEKFSTFIHFNNIN